MAVDPLIELRNVNKHDGELRVLRDRPHRGPGRGTRSRSSRERRSASSLPRPRTSTRARDACGLLNQADKYPARLSGGRRPGVPPRFMADGRIVEDRGPDEFSTNPRRDRAKDVLSKILEH